MKKHFTLRFPMFLFLSLILFMNAASAQEPVKSKRRIDNAWELPPLILNDLQGQSRTLSDWRGKVILLNFWATWCGPCRIEIPDFIDYQARYGDKGLQVIGVGLDSIENLRVYVAKAGVNYPVLQVDLERQYELLGQWGNSFGALPFAVVIGRDGQLMYMQQGLFHRDAFAMIVEPLLQ